MIIIQVAMLLALWLGVLGSRDHGGKPDREQGTWGYKQPGVGR